MSDLKALKARIDILDVLDKIGARIAEDNFAAYVDEVKVYCPFCADKDSVSPAASANPMKGLYFCYACGLGGTIIDLAMEYFQIGAGAAIIWLEREFPEPEKEVTDPWMET